MEDFIDSWGYLGVFVGILATGLGFPMPEELPIVLGGAMANSGKVYTWMMLPVCIVGVIIGDSFLYLIGRFWGTKLVELPFIRKNLLTPERLAKISENFKEYGVKILLFARLTPGIRAPIFLTAGITKLPITYFLLADGIYAIPGTNFEDRCLKGGDATIDLTDKLISRGADKCSITFPRVEPNTFQLFVTCRQDPNAPGGAAQAASRPETILLKRTPAKKDIVLMQMSRNREFSAPEEEMSYCGPDAQKLYALQRAKK